MGTLTKEMTGAGIRPMRMMGDRDLAITIGRFTFSNPYTSGGEAFTAANLDMQELLYVIPTPTFSAGTGAGNAQGGSLAATWNPGTSKMVAIATSGAAGNIMSAEVLHGTDLSAFTTRFLAIGYM